METLLGPVIISTSSRPAATASSTTYWMAGLSTTGSISLGVALVAGRNRVPSPAAGMTALVSAGGPPLPCAAVNGAVARAGVAPPDDVETVMGEGYPAWDTALASPDTPARHHRSRPVRLAAYRAASAERITSAAPRPWTGKEATPIDTVTWCCWRPVPNGSPRTAARIRS